MYTKWTSNIRDPNIKEQFEGSLKSAKPVLDRLTDILREDLSALHSMEESITQYVGGDWAYKQAHTNGFKACLRKVIKLIDLDKQEIS